MKEFSARLRQLRTSKELTQKELSQKLGFSRTTVNDWEVKHTEPNYDTLCKISDLFEVSVDFLLGRTDEDDWQ